MNLKTLFKIGAIWNGLFGLLMVFAGTAMMEGFGFTPTNDLLMMGTYMGMNMLAMATIHWFVPIYAGNNLKNFGMVAAAIWGAFVGLDAYHYAVGNNPFVIQNIIMTIVMAAIAVMFFFKSKD